MSENYKSRNSSIAILFGNKQSSKNRRFSSVTGKYTASIQLSTTQIADKLPDKQVKAKQSKNFKLSEIPKQIVLKALSQNSSYNFDTLQPKLGIRSVDDLLTDGFFGKCSLTLFYPNELSAKEASTPENLLELVKDLLNNIEKNIFANHQKFIGTEQFVAVANKGYFYR